LSSVSASGAPADVLEARPGDPNQVGQRPADGESKMRTVPSMLDVTMCLPLGPNDAAARGLLDDTALTSLARAFFS
jgi:hypothetical protein